MPGDKSVSHRALLFGAMAEGTTRITGLLAAEDVGRTRTAIQQLGGEVWVDRSGGVNVKGGPWRDGGTIDCGNSGTTARLLLGALAGRAGATLIGDASLSRRPMRRVLDPLARMGARIGGAGDERDAARVTLPVSVDRAALRGIEWRAEVASAQVKSAILLAGLAAEGETAYLEPVATRDHTERMLRGMGASIRVEPVEDGEGRRIVVSASQLQAAEITVPGDISSAAFWFVAAAIHPGARVTIEGVGVNPTRTGVLDVLRRMGAGVIVVERGGIEPIADVTVVGAELRGTAIGGAEIPTLIDELPALAVAAAFAQGETVVQDAAELRVKESDRIAAVVAGLRAIGVDADARPDGFVVRGGGAVGGHVITEGDHRIAMAFSIAGLRVPVVVSETESIRTSYPGFLERLAQLSTG
ncbi:3-phosphoshikimate 1-carboxyvinyltransferase [Deltaproteobacteria bacterium]|nr:3-phosphoshikimate 1-carboxyvinyltransferase [Deltaproteobacteria bacterium]